MNKETLQLDLNYFKAMGRYYGYPECCIKDFCDRYASPKLLDIPEKQSKASDQTGFIPCPEHAALVLNGKRKLKSLIKKRLHKEKFPYDLSDEPQEE